MLGLLGVVVHAQSALSVHLTLGNPSAAIASADTPNNHLILKPQYALAYSSRSGGPRWVAWHLAADWLGPVSRAGTFRADPALPPGAHRVTSACYALSGYDRGHLCPSADRTSTAADNQATFSMANILPQAPDNNQGPWARFEAYCRGLVRQGCELYILAGGEGTRGAIDAGRINVPDRIWKIVVVLPQGERDLERVAPTTRVIVVDLPNEQGIRAADWRIFRSNVDTLEHYTGFDFLSLVPVEIQATIEARVDDE